MRLSLKDFNKKDWILWIVSLVVVVASNLLTKEIDILTLIAAVVGATSLIFVAKGNVWGQVMVTLFCILYGIISWRFCYWGEMITYLGMSLPMAVWSAVTWFKNPAQGNKNQVKIQRLKGKQWGLLVVATIVVTVVFYFILRYFDTPNLLVSTISVTTSFFAASLTMLRSSYYALGYAANDVILIVLWTMASIEDSAYIPVVANFLIFLVNDINGFVSWKKRERAQKEF